MKKLLLGSVAALSLVAAGCAHGTIPSATVQVVDQGNGATTVFNYSFLIPYQSNGVTPAVTVQTEDPSGNLVTLAANAYVISGVGNGAGGSVTYNPGTPLPSGWSLIITRTLAYTQPIAVSNYSFYPHTVEVTSDNLDAQIQQLAQTLRQVPQLPNGDPSIPYTFPAAPARANTTVCFNSSGSLGLCPTTGSTGPFPATSLTYVGPGSGAITQTVSAKLGQYINVLDYGAKCDGVTNDTAAVGYAETYLESIFGGILLFPAGTCVISNTIAGNNIIWEGEPSGIASGGTKLVASSLTATAVTIGAVSASGLRNMVITSASQQTSGQLLYLNGGNFYVLDHVLVTHGYDDVKTNGVNVVDDQDGGARDFTNRGWYATGLSTALFFHGAFIIDQDSADSCGGVGSCTSPRAGFEMDYGGAVQFGNGTFIAHGHYDILLDPGAGQYVDWPEILPGSALDVCDFPVAGNIYQGGVDLDVVATGGGIVNGDQTEGWMGSCTNNVVLTTDTGMGSALTGVRFVGTTMVAAGHHAVILTNAQNISFTGALITGGGQVTTNTYPGVDLLGTATASFTGGAVGPAQGYGSGGGKTMSYAIQAETGWTGTAQCTGTDLRGNGTGAWNNIAATAGMTASNCLPLNGQGFATVTIGASPATYTNLDGVPETLNIQGGTVSSVAYSGPHTVCSATNCVVPTNPGQAVIITYSGLPTVTKYMQ